MAGCDIGERIRKDIDNYLYDNCQDDFRSHLGFSVIGKKCPREIWYHFRWFIKERHIGRMLRLFDRGHREEQRFIEWLSLIGGIVEPVDHTTGEQWLSSDFGGHFGGSCDGIVSNLNRYGLPGRGVLEAKTHNDKSFQALRKKGVATSKPTHYVQAQMYMNYLGLAWCIYMAVNKNDDDLHIEIIYAKPEIAEFYQARALGIINSPSPPPRMSENSSWYECRMCPAHELCHHRNDYTPELNCRTCVNSIPDTGDGTWYCALWQQTIPLHIQKQGCDQWQPRA